MESNFNAVQGFRYIGGKNYIKDDIVAMFPPHAVYCEVFGGMAHVLLAKKPAPIEVYNDLDSAVYNFFKVLQDPDKRAKLIELMELTPHSRQAYVEDGAYSYYNLPKPDGDLQHAYSFIVRVGQCRSGMLERYSKTGWGFSKTENKAIEWNNYPKRIAGIANRFKRVQVENYSFEKMFSLYDTEDTLFFCDPPYEYDKKERTTKKLYKYEFTQEQHEKLAALLLSIKGKFLLTHYDTELYRRLYACCNFRLINETIYSSNGNTNKSKRPLTSIIITNYEDVQLGLFGKGE